MFRTVLIANRGEIARRIIRTLDRMGIDSVAVYSEGDAHAPHMREATKAICIGPDPATESYLNTTHIIEAALKTGAEAIHPGYGFLAESTELARACSESGIAFIGPGQLALEVMGDKIRARTHLEGTGVPLIAGFSDAGQHGRLADADIANRAHSLGFPLLVKPSAGGGGKGMEVVRGIDELPEALATARRVAASAFGDDTLLLERLIERPRHIEVQVFGTTGGDMLALGERECTLQRRHQKVIEESPNAGGISEETVAALALAAVRVARSVDYVGAGTVEFLVNADQPDEFAFIEMNTRLQVEHPVTEEVLGLDLVELQLLTAAGEDIVAILDDQGYDLIPIVDPETAEQAGLRLEPQGHAIEARVYAESPEQGFLPSVGTILWCDMPAVARVDAAVEVGDAVSSSYDPMIAKIITHGANRADALTQLDSALRDTVILGVHTNVAFLRKLANHDRVRAGVLDTGLIEGMLPVAPADPPPPVVEAVAGAFAEMRSWDTDTRFASALWLTPGAAPAFRLRTGRDSEATRITLIDEAGKHFEASGGDHGEYRETLGHAGARGEIVIAPEHGEDPDLSLPVAVWAGCDGHVWRFEQLTRRQRTLLALEGRDTTTATHCEAPMPGTVTRIHVSDGDIVREGAPLVSVEAMKMEHATLAPHAGIAHIKVAVGDRVRRGQELAWVDPEEDAP